MKKSKAHIRKQKSWRRVIILASAIVVVAIGATTAWATISLVKPMDASYDVAIQKISGNATERSRAPEPATVTMFGGGLLGMIIRFIRKAYDRAKRLFDIVGATVALVILSPLMLLAAIVIKLTSRGPIIFRQIRLGKNHKPFQIYKFRTMRVDAEKYTGPVWAKENDDRLIPVGWFLRKTHIDEIPQFINVLRGEMSIIGPRPERPEFVAKLKMQIPDYERRLAVKPGITGLAQVWHRYDETIADVKKKVRYDLLYIKRMCFWTDFLIMLRTVRVVLTGEGAR